jgi:hypothetical protein
MSQLKLIVSTHKLQNTKLFLCIGINFSVWDEILAFGDEIGANFIYPQKSHMNNMSPKSQCFSYGWG